MSRSAHLTVYSLIQRVRALSAEHVEWCMLLYKTSVLWSGLSRSETRLVLDCMVTIDSSPNLERFNKSAWFTWHMGPSCSPYRVIMCQVIVIVLD